MQPTDTVFIVARAAEGPRMPLAVLRRQARDLPFDYRLDDSLAMSPEFRLSGQTRVVVVARISRSGNALPQPGDLSGQSTPVAPGASGVAVEIGSVVE
ncbi:c-type cytochrome biogenesis protein CcmI/CycH [Piscinibacter sakaiensis]